MINIINDKNLFNTCPTVEHFNAYSYRELLQVFQNKLNECIENFNFIDENTKKQLIELREKVNDLLNNGVGEEVKNSLNEMYNNGKLETIINQTIFTELSNAVNDFKNKMTNKINVKSFGAKGDGVADDTESIKNAINYAKENNANIIYFPKGTYLVNNTITLDGGFFIEGDGGRSSSTIIKTNTDIDLFVLKATWNGGGFKGIKISGTGKESPTKTKAISIIKNTAQTKTSAFFNFYDIFIENWNGTGIYFDDIEKDFSQFEKIRIVGKLNESNTNSITEYGINSESKWLGRSIFRDINMSYCKICGIKINITSALNFENVDCSHNNYSNGIDGGFGIKINSGTDISFNGLNLEVNNCGLYINYCKTCNFINMSGTGNDISTTKLIEINTCVLSKFYSCHSTRQTICDFKLNNGIALLENCSLESDTKYLYDETNAKIYENNYYTSNSINSNYAIKGDFKLLPTISGSKTTLNLQINQTGGFVYVSNNCTITLPEPKLGTNFTISGISNVIDITLNNTTFLGLNGQNVSKTCGLKGRGYVTITVVGIDKGWLVTNTNGTWTEI